jgi:hypothetical protein
MELPFTNQGVRRPLGLDFPFKSFFLRTIAIIIPQKLQVLVFVRWVGLKLSIRSGEKVAHTTG